MLHIHGGILISPKSEVSESERKKKGFSVDSDSKESACNAGDPGLASGSERSPREENGNPLQYSCLEDPMESGGLQSMRSQSLTGRSD